MRGENIYIHLHMLCYAIAIITLLFSLMPLFIIMLFSLYAIAMPLRLLLFTKRYYAIIIIIYYCHFHYYDAFHATLRWYFRFIRYAILLFRDSAIWLFIIIIELILWHYFFYYISAICHIYHTRETYAIICLSIHYICWDFFIAIIWSAIIFARDRPDISYYYMRYAYAFRYAYYIISAIAMLIRAITFIIIT